MKAPHSPVHPNHKGGVFHVVFFSASKGLNAKEMCKKKQKQDRLEMSLKESEIQKEWRYGGSTEERDESHSKGSEHK